ncbi:hypothetical protein DsansV1_C19g0162661 [Dioscorea sansibarensis]
MDSSMCSSMPDPRIWIIQNALAWYTPAVPIEVCKQTSPQENKQAIQVKSLSIHLWDPGELGKLAHHCFSLLENPYIPY